VPLEKISQNLCLSEDSDLLGCSGVSSGEWFPTFRNNVLQSPSRKRIRISVGERDFSLHNDVHICCGAHTVSCPLGSGSTFPRVKRTQREVDHLTPFITAVKNERSYATALAVRLHDAHRDSFSFNVSMDETSRHDSCQQFLINYRLQLQTHLH
jgi:hypothetical protein